MDLPSHVLWTYALEKITAPTFIDSHPKFVLASLFFSALPDLLETTPFLIYLTLHRKKLNLKNFRSILAFAVDVNHNRQEDYNFQFPWAARISFYTHSFLLYVIFSVLFYLFLHWLFLPFVIGYGLHLFSDIFFHNDYFSTRPLYPLSNFSIPGLFTWYRVRNFGKYNYGLLAVLYLILFLFV